MPPFLSTAHHALRPQNQAQLKPASVARLRTAVPALTDAQLAAMQVAPLRRFDPGLVQEPLVYRLYEARNRSGCSIMGSSC